MSTTTLEEPTKEQLEAIQDEFAEISPAELEAGMIEKAIQEDPTGSAGDKAAAFFQRSAVDLNMLLNGMSLRAIKRMVMNVATYPYLDRNYEIKRDSVEAKASYRFNEMVWQKTIMQLEFEQEKAMKALAEENTNTLSLEKGTNTNVISET